MGRGLVDSLPLGPRSGFLTPSPARPPCSSPIMIEQHVVCIALP
jgi:hypothetical protein